MGRNGKREGPRRQRAAGTGAPSVCGCCRYEWKRRVSPVSALCWLAGDVFLLSQRSMVTSHGMVEIMFLKGITGQRDVDRTFKEPKRGRKERKKASDISFCNWLERFDFFVASGF